MTKVSAVIPTRGKSDLLANLLRSLVAYAPGVEIIVVEHETTECHEIVEEIAPEAIYCRATDDQAPEERREFGLSYSDLNNIGAAVATGDVLWFINNDIVLRKGTAAAMLKVLEDKPDVGIVGCKLLKADNTIQHIGVVFDSFGIPSHLGYARLHERSYMPAHRSEYFDAVTFACAMVRRSTWEAIGAAFDTDYFFNYEDVDLCLRARQHGIRTYCCQEAVAIHLEGMSEDVRRSERHSRNRNLKVFRDKWVNTGLLGDVTGMRVQRDTGPLAIEKMNLVFVPSGRGVGVSWWRVDLPARKIAKKKLANVQMVYIDQNMELLLSVMQRADVVVWQGWHTEQVLTMAKLGRGRGHAMVYEYDDHPIYLSPYAECFRGLGTKEIQIQAGDGSEVWLWRDGENGFNLERNRQNRQRQLEIMSACDAMTTTTKPLADYFRSLNSRVHELPNCIDFDFYAPMFDLFDRRPGPVRIGWWGGDNHWHDVSTVGPWLKDFINGRDDARLIQIGAFYKGPFRGIDMNKVEAHEWVHVEAFPWRLAAAGMDVVVIPLALPSLPEMSFNKYKSDIKWLEAAAYKIPCLVQAGVDPYETAIDGVTCLKYTTREEFLEKLEMLTKDPALRRRLGQAAYDYAREYRDLDKNIEHWMDVYQAILKSGPAHREAPALAAQMANISDDELRPPKSNAVAEDVSRAS